MVENRGKSDLAEVSPRVLYSSKATLGPQWEISKFSGRMSKRPNP